MSCPADSVVCLFGEINRLFLLSTVVFWSTRRVLVEAAIRPKWMGEIRRWFLIVVTLGVFYWLCYVHYTSLTYVNGRFYNEYLSNFKKHKNVAHLNCSRYFRPNSSEMRSYQRIGVLDPEELSMDCQEIRRRRTFASNVYPEEVGFELAIVKAVYKDYIFHESEISAIYSPNNFYCYVLDSKADKLFKTRLRSLASCFENFIVPDMEFDMTSDGTNIIPAQHHCLELLLSKKWEYVFMLENNDMMIKTNRELVKILRLYDGANDVSASSLKRLTQRRVKYAKEMDLSLKNLRIFRDASLNLPNVSLKPIKSLTQSTFSYAAVHYMFNALNLEVFKNITNQGRFTQELFVATLNANEVLKIPGGFTEKCRDTTAAMTRFTKWRERRGCRSRKMRHQICILDMNDLHEMARSPRFTANKMLQEFDFGGISCWHEYIYNRQHSSQELRINEAIYLNVPHVKYHRLKKKGTLRSGQHFNLTLVLASLLLSSEAKHHYTADEIKDLRCPQCLEVQDGDFSEFFVVYEFGDADYLSRTNIEKEMELGDKLYAQAMYRLFEYPVFIKDDFEPFLVECNNEGQLKMSQTKDKNGDFKIIPTDPNLARNRSEYCFETTKRDIDQSKAFLYKGLYVTSPTVAYNVSTICTGTKTIEMKQFLKEASNSGATMPSEDDFTECFDTTKNFTCVYDVDSTDKFHKLEGRSHPTYMRNGLIVYAGCNGKRCAYFIYDTVTGLDWYLPDSIKFAKEHLKGMHTIDLLIPLIQPTDKFITSSRRYQNETSDATGTKKITTTTEKAAKTTKKEETKTAEKTTKKSTDKSGAFEITANLFLISFMAKLLVV
ncbi:unnamed protein product [Bursaphelenchus xylophilus]|uniref:(pine wood nematode) hypothetical protein n=1 Tax=Bursaphelenchus xylophilus TaxID=6326 RepID=A0A1I7SFV7_BURXY|nr:unnamed protein product [Bursaphelenchus xylophilus]CAG9106351.1 unnamed protein product [Bursaphelenchus xylophilus]